MQIAPILHPQAFSSDLLPANGGSFIFCFNQPDNTYMVILNPIRLN
jgi:hypothetical protein